MHNILPKFQDGVLPQGDYKMTLSDLRASHLVMGDCGLNTENWDCVWRAYLVDNLEIMVKQLWAIGIDNIFIDGSFVEDKDHPNDIDGYFECDIRLLASGKLEQNLNLLDADKIWTWNPNSRKAYQGYPKKQLPMWHKYRVEMYPHIQGMSCGIKDIHGNELEFPAAFRLSRRDDKPKGIIQIIKGNSI